MRIRCKKTKRFLLEIDIEEYLENLRKIGIKQELPLRITLPCPRCHKVEVYDIYDNRYVFIENVNKLS
jgi:phage FluMu protein Com